MADEKSEAATKLASKKEELLAKRNEFEAFLTEKGLKKGTDYTNYEADKNVRIKWTRLNKEVKALQGEADELRKAIPKKEKKAAEPRETKYNYPAGADGDAKKKFRQAMRVKAKLAGVDVDTYLGSPDKFAKAIAAKEAEKAEKMRLKGEKLAAASKAKKEAENGTEDKANPAAAAAPVKKKKVAATTED